MNIQWRDCWWTKQQHFGHLMWKANSLENTLMLEKIERKRRRGQGRMRQLDDITDINGHEFESGRWWRTRKPGVLQSMGSQRVRHDWATEQQERWTLKYTHDKTASLKSSLPSCPHTSPFFFFSLSAMKESRGIEPGAPEVRELCPNHQTSREFPCASPFCFSGPPNLLLPRLVHALGFT